MQFLNEGGNAPVSHQYSTNINPRVCVPLTLPHTTNLAGTSSVDAKFAASHFPMDRGMSIIS